MRAGLLTLGVAGAVTLGFYGFAKLHGRSFGDLSRDPVTVLGGVYYTGYYSNLVVLAWSVAAISSVFAGLVLGRAGYREAARCLLAGGALSSVMLLDDFFLLHEEVYRHAGVPEFVVYLAYTAGMLGFALRYRHRLGAGMLLVFGTLSCWGISTVIDLINKGPFVLEDGAKAAGVALWSLLMIRHAAGELLRVIRRGVG